MPRVLLDLSALILIKRENLLRRLGVDIRRGQVAVAAYSLNRLRKNPRWRDWVTRNDNLLRVRPQSNDEHELFYRLMSEYGSVQCNPYVDPDDLMAIAIATSRPYPLVMRDRVAEAVARRLGVRCIPVDDFIRHLTGRR